MTESPRGPIENGRSWERPAKLQAAYAAYDAGTIDTLQLEVEQDEAVKDSIEQMEEIGQPIVSDGEQRRTSFAMYPFTDSLAGTGLEEQLAPGNQHFAIVDDGHHRQFPRLASGPCRHTTYAGETLAKSIGLRR